MKYTKKQENMDWLELCDYVKKEILQYPSDIKFPRYLALRLRGLHDGQFMGNKKQTPLANYDYKVILITFKACKLKILGYTLTNKNKIVDEKHLINIIMLFIEDNINDVIFRMKNAEAHKIQSAKIEVEEIKTESIDYEIKEKNKKIDSFKDLW